MTPDEEIAALQALFTDQPLYPSFAWPDTRRSLDGGEDERTESSHSVRADGASSASVPAAASDPSIVARWRRRIAGGLLLVAGIALLASYFLPWSSGAQVPGRDTCPTCMPEVFTHTAWSLISPAAVHWENTVRDLTHGNASFLLAYTLAVCFQLVVPVAFVVLGWRLLTRATPVRLRWRVLVVLYCVPELLVAWALLDITMWDSLVSLSPAIGFYLACAAVMGFFVAGLLMPHTRRQLRARAVRAT